MEGASQDYELVVDRPVELEVMTLLAVAVLSVYQKRQRTLYTKEYRRRRALKN